MEKYHSRKPEKMITDQAELIEVIQKQKFLTLALCKDGEPYIVTLNYAYDKAANCFYIHSAPQGKKYEFLAANPVVWGQILEDRGYLQGECDHNYRTVQFKGRVEFLRDVEEIRAAMFLMIDQLEENPEPTKKRLIGNSSFDFVAVGKIHVEGMTGKKGR